MAPSKIFVIDPINRTGKIAVPLNLTQETRGLDEYLQSKNQNSRDLSLCLLFQKGKCNAGTRCHQIHADKDFIATLREAATSKSTCCAAHGDVHSTNWVNDKRSVQLVTADGSVSFHTLSSFGVTQALESMLKNCRSDTLRLNVNKVCRLHGQSRCKFGRDCKNVHLCREVDPSTSSKDSTPRKIQTICDVDNIDVKSNSSSNISSTHSTPKAAAIKPEIADTTPVAISSEVSVTPAAADATPVTTATASIRKRCVEAPKPADYFRLEDVQEPALPLSTPSKESTSFSSSGRHVGFSPVMSPFQVLTPQSTMSSASSLPSSTRGSAIVRPLMTSVIAETQRGKEAILDATLLQRPLTRSKIGISPSSSWLGQCDVDMRKLCADILGSLSPSWVVA